MGCTCDVLYQIESCCIVVQTPFSQTCGRWWSALWSLWRHRVWDTLVSTTRRLAPTRWTSSTVLGPCGRAACSEVYSNLLSFGIVVVIGLVPIFSDNLQDGRCDLEPSRIADYRLSQKMKHFRWWNVFDDMCVMGQFWSWFDVNRSTFDEDMREKLY